MSKDFNIINALKSFYDLLNITAIPNTQANLRTKFAQYSAVTINLFEDYLPKREDYPCIVLNYLKEGYDRPSRMQLSNMVQMDAWTNLSDLYANRFIRSSIFNELGLKRGRSLVRSWQLLKDYDNNVSTPPTIGRYSIELMGGVGWEKIPVDGDPESLHYASTLEISHR